MGNFEEKYYQLVKYLSENNNLLPTNGHSLYHFINRLKATQDSLSRYQLSLLNEIDFFNLKSAPNQQEKNWIKKFNQLKDYIEIHGKPPGQIRTSRYPDRYINGKWKTKEEADLHSLSIWVLSQKQNYKKNELSNERINLLSEIGFYFNAKQKFPFTIKMYEQRLKEIVAEGNTNDHKDYHNINNWIKRTNKGLEKYDEKSIIAFKDLEKKFNSLESKHEKKWKENFEKFKNHYAHYRALPIANGLKWSPSYNKWSEEYKIAIWLRVNTISYQKGTLSEKKVNLLKEIFPEFGQRRRAKRVSWEERYYMFKAFVDNFGREPRQNKGDLEEDIEESKLAMWALKNRSLYHNTHQSGAKLSKKQMKMLKEINFNFDFLSYH